MRLFALCFAIVALAGCADMRGREIVDSATGALTGQSKAQVLACLGPPDRQATDGGVEVLSYRLDEGVTGGGGVFVGATLIRTDEKRMFCDARILFRGGLVQSISTTGKASSCGTLLSACAPKGV